MPGLGPKWILSYHIHKEIATKNFITREKPAKMNMQPFANTAIIIINERSRNPLKHKEIPAIKKHETGFELEGPEKS